MNTYDFIDSAFKAGFPYVLEIEVKVDGRLDGVELRSYKDSATAWRVASRKMGKIFELYKEDNAVAYGHIWKCSAGDGILNWHDLICTIGSYDHGSYRNVTRSLYEEHELVRSDTLRIRG